MAVGERRRIIFIFLDVINRNELSVCCIVVFYMKRETKEFNRSWHLSHRLSCLYLVQWWWQWHVLACAARVHGTKRRGWFLGRFQRATSSQMPSLEIYWDASSVFSVKRKKCEIPFLCTRDFLMWVCNRGVKALPHCSFTAFTVIVLDFWFCLVMVWLLMSRYKWKYY